MFLNYKCILRCIYFTQVIYLKFHNNPLWEKKKHGGVKELAQFHTAREIEPELKSICQ